MEWQMRYCLSAQPDEMDRSDTRMAGGELTAFWRICLQLQARPCRRWSAQLATNRARGGWRATPRRPEPGMGRGRTIGLMSRARGDAVSRRGRGRPVPSVPVLALAGTLSPSAADTVIHTRTRHCPVPTTRSHSIARQKWRGGHRQRRTQPDRSVAAAVDRVDATWAPPAGPSGRCICLARRPPGGLPAYAAAPRRALPCVPPCPLLFSPLFCLLSANANYSPFNSGYVLCTCSVAFPRPCMQAYDGSYAVGG
jgi:hypothetical protein